MNFKVIKKALGFLVIDTLIIIGIFILQFRTDSSIIEKIGNLQLIMSKSDADSSDSSLNNQLQILYNGLNIHFNQQNPAQILTTDSKIQNIVLLGYSKKQPLEYTFYFSNDIELTVELLSEGANSSFEISTNLPDNVQALYLPYSYSSNMHVQKQEQTYSILNSKKNSWEFNAPNLENNLITFTNYSSIAHYSIYDTTKKFSFDSVIELAIASKDLYLSNVKNLKASLISAYKSSNSEQISEQAIVSYVAAMAEQGNYTTAIEEISPNFKKSPNRTYLSAPYFNSLENMNINLTTAINNINKTIAKSALTGSLEVFTVKSIANYLCLYQNSNDVNKILQSAANANLEQASISEATGIILAFTELAILNTDYAQILSPIIDNCLAKIENACNFESNILTISENDTFLSVVQAVETGMALIRYAELTDNEALIKAGYVILNSYISENSSFDLRTLSNLYPLIAYDNWYYPHFTKITSESQNYIWAWTCAKDISFSRESEYLSQIDIDFPEGQTHYVILKEIPSFTSIYIYDIAFRTDARFETYNSSGYVYKTNTKTLLLKSRQKSNIEHIRFDSSPKKAKEPAIKPESEKEMESQVEIKISEPDEDTISDTIENTETTEETSSSENENSIISSMPNTIPFPQGYRP